LSINYSKKEKQSTVRMEWMTVISHLKKRKKGIIEPFYGHFKINYEKKMVISSY
jgi:hypothetical protein